MVRYGLLFVTVMLLAGCKYLPKLDEVLPDKRSEYKKSQTLPDLEVPPDLSTESINDKMALPDEEGATFSTYQERVAARKKAREEEGLAENAIEALSGEKVIVVGGDIGAVWDKLHDYWAERGFALDLDDAEYGVQETKWREDQENLIRDRYKVFAEAGEKKGTMTLYVSHEGEQLRPEGEELVWKRRTDARATEQFVADLKAYLRGTSSDASATATATPAGGGTDEFVVEGATEEARAQAEIVNSGDGKFYLAYPLEFSQAWTNTGNALPKAGLTVAESDKGRGIYLVRYTGTSEKKGFLSKLAFWKGDKAEYQLSVTGVGKKTEIVVLDEDGKWDNSEAAGQILSLLKDELNKTQ